MAPTVRETLSEPQAHACLALVKKQFAAYLDAERGHRPFVRLVEPGPGRPRRFWEIVWESGSPYEWAHLATSGGVDEEMANEMTAMFPDYEPKPMEPIAWPEGVHAEVGEFSFIVALYPA